MELIDRVIEDLRNNTTEKGARFAQSYLLHKVLGRFGQERNDDLNKDMYQLYRQTCLSLFSLNT